MELYEDTAFVVRMGDDEWHVAIGAPNSENGFTVHGDNPEQRANELARRWNSHADLVRACQRAMPVVASEENEHVWTGLNRAVAKAIADNANHKP